MEVIVHDHCVGVCVFGESICKEEGPDGAQAAT